MIHFLMRWLFRRSSQDPTPSEDSVVVVVRLSGGEFGSEQERKDIQSLGGRIDAILARDGVGELDGDEFGDHTGTLYFYGPDAERIFAMIEPVLRSWPKMAGGYVIKRFARQNRQQRLEF
jgi:hypothetical protein